MSRPRPADRRPGATLLLVLGGRRGARLRVRRQRIGLGETGSNAGGSDDAALAVSVANYQFSPATIKVDSGDAIELTNTNPQTPHTFTVTDEDIDASLDPGPRPP